MEIGTKHFCLLFPKIVNFDSPDYANFILIMITGAVSTESAILIVAVITMEFRAALM